MDIVELVLFALLLETICRAKSQTGGNVYPITIYKPLVRSDGCPLEKNISCTRKEEKPVCVRNVTRTNLVEACVRNITITYGCPVFVKAKNMTHDKLTLVQFEDESNCSSCPTKVYGLHDIEKYTACMQTFSIKRTTDPGITESISKNEQESSTECERYEEFNRLKKNILIFAGAILGFAILLGLSTYVVYRLRR